MNHERHAKRSSRSHAAKLAGILLAGGPTLALLVPGAPAFADDAIPTAPASSQPSASAATVPASPPSASAMASASASASAPTIDKPALHASAAERRTLEEAEFVSGSHLRYGLTTSLLRFSVSRRPSEPAALRDYVPTLEPVPADVAFSFMYEPNKSPWRLCKKDGKPFQLLSWGGALFVDPSAPRRDQRSISLALMLGLFENWISLGAGVDLYRGIPTQGSDGESGTGTAYTGLLGWALSRRGEVTPENVFITVALDLSKAVTSATGTVR